MVVVMTEKEMLEMPLHDYRMHGDIKIIRVPGGWVYGNAFVPEPEKEINVSVGQKYRHGFGPL